MGRMRFGVHRRLGLLVRVSATWCLGTGPTTDPSCRCRARSARRLRFSARNRQVRSPLSPSRAARAGQGGDLQPAGLPDRQRPGADTVVLLRRAGFRCTPEVPRSRRSSVRSLQYLGDETRPRTTRLLARPTSRPTHDRGGDGIGLRLSERRVRTSATRDPTRRGTPVPTPALRVVNERRPIFRQRSRWQHAIESSDA